MPRGVATDRAGRDSGLGIHPPSEVRHPPVRHSLLARRHRTRLLCERVKKQDEVAGALVEHSVAGAPKPNAQLAQLGINLGCDRKLGRWGIWGSVIQVLAYVLVDLGRMRSWEGLDEQRDRFRALPVAVVDGLRSGDTRLSSQDRRLSPLSQARRGRSCLEVAFCDLKLIQPPRRSDRPDAVVLNRPKRTVLSE